MKYMGSKNRLSKYILPYILKDRLHGQYYVEPFVGGANLIDKVGGNRIGGDSHKGVIVLFTGIQNGYIPPDSVSEKQYYEAKRGVLSPEQAFIGFGCSYSGKWWGGYARGNSSQGFPRNYCLESKRNILKQRQGILGIQFKHSSYDTITFPSNSIIYCDPPYKGTTSYKNSIDYETFYVWCRKKRLEGHTIFISEFSMPPDFIVLWEKERVTSLTQDTGNKRDIERLYTLA